MKTQLICLQSDAPPLLGRKTADALKLLKLENVNLVETETVKLEKKFPGLTRGIGKLKGTSVNLNLNLTGTLLQSIMTVTQKRGVLVKKECID